MMKFKYSFLIALLIHLLILLSFTLVLYYQDQIYYAKIDNRSQSAGVLATYMAQMPQVTPMKSHAITQPTSSSSTGLIKKKNTARPQPTTLATSNDLMSVPNNNANTGANFFSPENNKIDAPLLRLLSAATAAHFVYPQIAITFRETGIVIVKFLLTPNGVISNVKIAKSSGFQPLDEASFNAIQSMSPVRGVSFYLKKPEVIHAHFIFE